MVYCRKCGAPMSDNATVCGKCGAAVDSEKADASRKSILIKDLERFRDLLSEVEELDTMIRPQSEFPVSDNVSFMKRSLIRFFWPYIAAGVGAAVIIYAISAIIAFYSAMSKANYVLTKSEANRLTSGMVGDVYIGYFVALIVCLAIIFIGLKIARSKQASFNKNADYLAREVTEKYKQGLKNQKMLDIRDEDIREMRKYSSLVPEKNQNSESVSKIINLIKTDKAATVEEACEIIG